jgi:predicted ABC-type ATPase
MPRCLIIAGPNGAGKTTFAREFLPAANASSGYDVSGPAPILISETP